MKISELYFKLIELELEYGDIDIKVSVVNEPLVARPIACLGLHVDKETREPIGILLGIDP